MAINSCGQGLAPREREKGGRGLALFRSLLEELQEGFSFPVTFRLDLLGFLLRATALS